MYAAYKAQLPPEGRARHEHAYLAAYCQVKEQGLVLLQANGEPSNAQQCIYSLMTYRPSICGIAAVPDRCQIILLPEMLADPALDGLLLQWRAAFPEAGYWRWRDQCLEIMDADGFVEWIAAWRHEVEAQA